MQVRNDVRIGEEIGIVRAIDSDGTAPGNVVRYELSEEGSSDKALQYFSINPETGAISVQNDLTQELYDEYRVSPQQTS